MFPLAPQRLPRRRPQPGHERFVQGGSCCRAAASSAQHSAHLWVSFFPLNCVVLPGHSPTPLDSVPNALPRVFKERAGVRSTCRDVGTITASEWSATARWTLSVKAATPPAFHGSSRPGHCGSKLGPKIGSTSATWRMAFCGLRLRESQGLPR